MQKNVHDYERIGRVVGGITLSSLAFWGPRKIWFLGFLVPVITGLMGKCPLYSSLGISTRKSEQADNDYFPVKSDSELAAGHPIVGVT
jgi:hypothetical protein